MSQKPSPTKAAKATKALGMVAFLVVVFFLYFVWD
jgi:hypothetical protein